MSAEERKKRRTKLNELDSYNEFVEKISESIMATDFDKERKKLKESLSVFGTPPSRKELLKRLGASPGKLKAVTGETMADGGVVDLTTEMVIDE
jgi:hypothetical protein